MTNITVYSSPWCAGCKTVKKFLESNNCTYTEVDISTVAGAAAAKLADIRSIPVTIVGDVGTDDVLVFTGSRPDTLKDILEAVID